MSKADELNQLASQATELVENLKTLQQRIGHYSSARDDLRSASAALSEMTSDLRLLTSRFQTVLQKLEQIDAVTLAAQVSDLGLRLEKVNTSLSAEVAEVAANLEKASQDQKSTHRLAVVGLVLLVAILGATIRMLVR